MTRYSMAVDPGGQHTGIVLAELTDDGPVPVDGLTLDRTEEERDTRHMGAPQYVRRVIAACFAMLEKHGVADDSVQIIVETMVPPTPVQPGTSIVPWPSGATRSEPGRCSAGWPQSGRMRTSWPRPPPTTKRSTRRS
jgi:hypothetical protein